MGQLERRTLALDGRAKAGFSPILFSEISTFVFNDANGRLLTEQLRLGASNIRIGLVRSTGHRISLAEDRDATLLFPRSGTLGLRIAGRERRVVANGGRESLLAQPAARETLVRATRHGPFEGHVMLLPMSDLRGLAELAGVGAFLGRDVLPVQGPAARRLSAYIAFVLSDLDQADVPAPSGRTIAGMVALFRDLVADWLAEAQQAGGIGAAAASSVEHARVLRAEDVLRARADEPLSVAELARDLGLSLRSLQLAFQKVHGEGPRERLTRIRLERARKMLLDDQEAKTVTMIALDCGFTHLGRFAGAYLRAFGERPGETLARSRRSAGR